VTIPATISGLPVTAIGLDAFYNETNVTGITIPDSVTNIDSRAFSFCSRLVSLQLGNHVTSIGDTAFYGCALTNLTLPDSVTQLGSFAIRLLQRPAPFHWGTNLASISDSFSYCDSLTNVTLLDSPTYIGRDAFFFCSSLASVNLGTNASAIGEQAFPILLGPVEHRHSQTASLTSDLRPSPIVRL
jgi:hypothetical protein